MTDITHDVWTGCMDDAQMGAITDVMYDVWTGCMDDAWMGAMTDITYDVLTDGDFTRFLCRQFTTFFSPELQRNFDGFAADGDELMDRLPV